MREYTKFYIDGEWVEPASAGSTIEVVDSRLVTVKLSGYEVDGSKRSSPDRVGRRPRFWPNWGGWKSPVKWRG